MSPRFASRSAIALAAAIALPTASHAYVRETSNWNPASLPISYRINLSSAPSSIGASTAQAAIDGGMATWAAPVCTRWRATNAGTTSIAAARAGDRENSFLWISGSWPAELGAVNSTIGVTTPVWNSGGYFIDADIQFNNVGFRWSTTGASNTVDTQSIATHEEGHFLGLDHTTVRSAVMYPSYSGGTLRALSSDDTAGVCAIYPSGAAVPDAGVVDAGTSSDPCSRYTSCAGCTPVNGCGWCGATGRCVTSTSSGPAGGACASGFAWLPRECTATTPDAGSRPDVPTTPDVPAASDVGGVVDPCSRYTTCDTCAPVNPCGWCGATGRCVSGTPTGPSSGTCGGGYVWDPSTCSGTTTPPAGTAAFGEPCAQPADCASGGLCVGSSSIAPFCTRVCVDDCSCPRGFRCGARLSTGQNVCIPGTNTCDVAPDASVTPDASLVPDVTTMPDATTRPDATATPDASAPPVDMPAPSDDTGMTKTDATSAGDTATGDDAEVVLPGGSTGGSSSGCGCDVPGPSRPSSVWLFAVAGVALVSRRRRR